MSGIRPHIVLTESNQSRLKELSGEVRERLEEMAKLINTNPDASDKAIAKVSVELTGEMGTPVNSDGHVLLSGKAKKVVRAVLTYEDGTRSCHDDPPGVSYVC